MTRKYIEKPGLSPSRDDLLRMEVGDAILVSDDLIVHRVYSGWVYQFKRASTGGDCMAVAFVPLDVARNR